MSRHRLSGRQEQSLTAPLGRPVKGDCSRPNSSLRFDIYRRNTRDIVSHVCRTRVDLRGLAWTAVNETERRNRL